MKHPRPLSRTLAVPLLLLVLVANLVAACGASSRQKSIQTTYTALRAAEDAFVAYDQDHRASIVTHATSHENGVALLNEWDGTADRVVKALSGGYRAVAAAATLNDDQSFAAMLAAALIVKSELDALGVTKAGGL